MGPSRPDNYAPSDPWADAVSRPSLIRAPAVAVSRPSCGARKPTIYWARDPTSIAGQAARVRPDR